MFFDQELKEEIGQSKEALLLPRELGSVIVASLNVKGLNFSIKHKDIRNFIRMNKVSILDILETKVRENNFEKTSATIFGDWDVLNNYVDCPRGRIWIGWSKDVMKV